MHCSNKKRGMTLTEVIVTVSILIVVIIAVGAFQYDVINYNNSSSVALTNSQEVQVLIKVMARELRSMENGSNGAYPIVEAGTSTITFYTDAAGDGKKERIHYYLSGGVLYRGFLDPSGSPAGYTGTESKKILATGVVNSSSIPLFEYFDSMYAGTSTPMTYPLNITSIRLVKFSIALDSDPKKSPSQRTFSTQVSLRNLKDNL